MNLVETRRLKCLLGHEPLFEDLDFAIKPGQAVLLQGRNGSGKSTFLRSLIGNQVVDEGTIWLGGRLMERLNPSQRELIAPMVDQSPLLNWDVSALDNLIDSVAVGSSLLSWFFTPREMVRKRILDEYGKLIERFGLTSVIHRPARELSIGQRRLLTLLRALRRRPGGKPRVLLLDEPLAGLRGDRIETVLTELRERLDEGWAIIVAEHVPEVATLNPRVLAFPYRKEQRPASQSQPQQFVTAAIGDLAIGDVVEATPVRSNADAIGSNGEARGCLLTLSNVSVGYYEWEIVSDVNLQVRAHQITAMVGPNAAGKSTVFRALFKDEQTKPWLRGKVEWGDREVRHVRDKRHIPRDAVAWIPQERFDFPGMTVDETLGGALMTDEFQGITAALKDVVGGLRPAENAKREEILTLVKRLREKRPDGKTILESHWETLSGGERAIATLAMGLINTPTVVFLDEPAANLDVRSLAVLKDILRTYVEQHDAGCLLIEHRVSFLRGFANRIVEIGTDGSTERECHVEPRAVSFEREHELSIDETPLDSRSVEPW